MRQPSQQLASLSSALLLLLVAATLWSTATADFVLADYPELPTSPAERHLLHRRHEQIEQRLARQPPIGVRKMSEDPSEKFFPEYWQFDIEDQRFADRQLHKEPEIARDGNEDHDAASHRTAEPVLDADYSNVSMVYDLLPPILPHKLHTESSTFLRNLPRNLFHKRGYQCPTGYHNCNSIGFKNSCCATDETCKIIRNTGIGVVGCCPAGSKCSGSVSMCDIAKGYKSCPNSRNKNGCCAPGFRCDAIGCIKIVATATIRTTRISVTVKTIVSTAVVKPTQRSTVYITSTYPTKTKVIGPVVESFKTNTTVVTTTITRAVPPVRPTEVKSGGQHGSSSTLGVCPTGYYRCSAFYLGGCCRVGRNCHSTHCPVRVSTEATRNGVVTVIVETGKGVTTINEGTFTVVTGTVVTHTVVTKSASVAAATTSTNLGDHGPCALGWSKCAANKGGGCCPDGYRCGASCTATQAGLPGKVPKAPPVNQAGVLERWGIWTVGVAGAVGFGMIWL